MCLTGGHVSIPIEDPHHLRKMHISGRIQRANKGETTSTSGMHQKEHNIHSIIHANSESPGLAFSALTPDFAQLTQGEICNHHRIFKTLNTTITCMIANSNPGLNINSIFGAIDVRNTIFCLILCHRKRGKQTTDTFVV